MDVEELMSGIAVVIDDALPVESNGVATKREDMIGHIVNWFETEWKLPFVKRTSLPEQAFWPSLLQAASFVLLDWRLWGSGGDTLKDSVIDDIRGFLKSARENLVPVFILTNEDPDEVLAELRQLPADVYDEHAAGTNFVFVEQKSGFWSGTSVDVGRLKEWVHGNASVYALKTWDRVLDGAKSELFRAMCARSVNWPRVFWETYTTDGAAPSASLTNLINDSLRGRMRLDAFKDEHLGGGCETVASLELRELIAETSFRRNEFLPEEEIRCGDLYRGSGGKYWLNMRPDCDCIPREGVAADEVEVYCVEGKKLGPSALEKAFDRDSGSFKERVFQSVAFGIVDGTSLEFNFKKLRVLKFSDVRAKRVGRLLHPYLTRIQQRYALYTQRQALPRVPGAAVPEA